MNQMPDAGGESFQKIGVFIGHEVPFLNGVL